VGLVCTFNVLRCEDELISTHFYLDLHEYTIGPLVIPTKDRPSRSTGDQLPVTLGHEFCGHVAQAPENAVSADGSPIVVGQPVMVDPRLNCRSCFSCKGGETNLCDVWGFLGLSGGGTWLMAAVQTWQSCTV
jgi:threonine dehydrogenase-like Zn-dependent dehydrogenase